MPSDARIENIVVLMLENRSFDHMLGFLKEKNPDVKGLTLANPQSNPQDCGTPGSPRVPVTKQATFSSSPDPGHDIKDVNVQLFCNTNPPDTSKGGARARRDHGRPDPWAAA